MAVEIRKMDVDGLTIQEIIALLDIAQGASLRRPDWRKLKRELAQFELCGIYQAEQLAGYALVNSRSCYLPKSAQIVTLRYLWQYNQAPLIAEMIRGVGALYRDAQWMILDVNARQDFNIPLYKNLGFQASAMRSSLGREHTVMLCPMAALLGG